jgi:hypothetical protein
MPRLRSHAHQQSKGEETTVRTKVGVALGAAALVGTVAFAATSVFGAGASRPAKLHRSATIAAHARFGDAAAAKAPRASDKTLYGVAKTSIPPGDATVTLGKCPRKSHIVNATVAALHGDQAPYLTISGYGIFGKKPNKWFIDVHNGTGDPPRTGGPSGTPFDVKALGYIICDKG